MERDGASGAPHSPGRGKGELAGSAAVQEQHTAADPVMVLFPHSPRYSSVLMGSNCQKANFSIWRGQFTS